MGYAYGNKKADNKKQLESGKRPAGASSIQRVEVNKTGIPGQIKQSFEQRSGFSFDDVRVHYGSQKPKEVGALAYTQGNQVYVGPGQEKHLRHELVHVVQQKRGMVQPTRTFKRYQINDDSRLEQEADRGIF